MASKYPEDAGDASSRGNGKTDASPGLVEGARKKEDNKSTVSQASIRSNISTLRPSESDVFTFDNPLRVPSSNHLTESPPLSPFSMTRNRPQSPRTPSRRKPDTEDNVVMQTEDVFKSFMRQRYVLDQRADAERLDAATPYVPEMMQSSLSPLSSTAEVGRQLAQIGDDIDARYGAEFKQLIGKLRITQDTAYEAFAGVCRKLFSDNTINWGRIVTLLQFGYRMAIEYINQGLPEFLCKIVAYLVQFIAKEKVLNAITSIASWIAEQGGWVAVVTQGFGQLGASVTSVLTIVLVCALTLSIAAWMKR